MTFAIHSIHAPACEIDEQGAMTHDGTHRIKLPPPIFVADTMDEAEEWRAKACGEGNDDAHQA